MARNRVYILCYINHSEMMTLLDIVRIGFKQIDELIKLKENHFKRTVVAPQTI
jgi:hypothetical protein